MQGQYNPAVFNVNDIPQAMRIILTPEDSTTEERWRTETPYLADLIDRSFEFTPQTIMLDYGCGIGRLAKEMITRHGCRVVGVDISPSMRALAVIYVQSDRFFACAPTMLEAIIERGFRFDGAVSIWVLQHCQNPSEDIARIRHALQSEGRLFVVNNINRAIPTLNQGWLNDGIDIKSMLGAGFALREEGRPTLDKTSQLIAQHTFWASYSQRP